jgi:2,3-diaminopropionate biosynthesis protein SbnB
MHDMRIIPGHVAVDILRRRGAGIVDLVAETYLLHDRKETINPDSYFLRFPDNELNRIIALPSAILDENPVSGIKWIASYPGNVRNGLPRASAVIILNDAETGFPTACIEGSQISALRTAAAAVLGADRLRPPGRPYRTIGVIGAGIIARNILETYRLHSGTVEEVLVHDLDEASREALCAFVRNTLEMPSRVVGSVAEVFAADLVVLATSAGKPYIVDRTLPRPGQVILNISLRDLSPEIVLDAWNIVDDVQHCLKANTSPHLAAQKTGNHDFIAGTIADLILGRIEPDRSKAAIFSPFGLGVLDLALARVVLAESDWYSGTLTVPDFFPELRRWESVA